VRLVHRRKMACANIINVGQVLAARDDLPGRLRRIRHQRQLAVLHWKPAVQEALKAEGLLK
jgi:hypothetical protein